MSLNLFQDFDNSAKDIFVNTAQVDISMQVGLPANPNIRFPIFIDGTQSIITAEDLNTNFVDFIKVDATSSVAVGMTGAPGVTGTIYFVAPGAGQTGYVSTTITPQQNGNGKFQNLTVVNPIINGSQSGAIGAGTIYPIGTKANAVDVGYGSTGLKYEAIFAAIRADGTILNQSGGLQNIAHTLNTGLYVLTTDKFTTTNSLIPYAFAQIISAGATGATIINTAIANGGATQSAFTFQLYNSAGALTDFPFNVHLVGPVNN